MTEKSCDNYCLETVVGENLEVKHTDDIQAKSKKMAMNTAVRMTMRRYTNYTHDVEWIKFGASVNSWVLIGNGFSNNEPKVIVDIRLHKLIEPPQRLQETLW